MTYGASIGDVSEDVTWPYDVILMTSSLACDNKNSVTELLVLIFGTLLNIGKPEQQKEKFSLKGAWPRSHEMTLKKFDTLKHISKTSKATDLEFCTWTQVDNFPKLDKLGLLKSQLIGHNNYSISIASTREPIRLPACSISILALTIFQIIIYCILACSLLITYWKMSTKCITDVRQSWTVYEHVSGAERERGSEKSGERERSGERVSQKSAWAVSGKSAAHALLTCSAWDWKWNSIEAHQALFERKIGLFFTFYVCTHRSWIRLVEVVEP